jgi:hypothetical protein
MLNIPLTPEKEARLKARAAAAGKNVAEYVLDVVEEDLAMTEAAPLIDTSSTQQRDEWEKALDAWAAGHPHLATMADDSRESIYEGRGE